MISGALAAQQEPINSHCARSRRSSVIIIVVSHATIAPVVVILVILVVQDASDHLARLRVDQDLVRLVAPQNFHLKD